MTEKGHSCSECSKFFRRKGDLTRHEAIHSGIKPYQCKVCDKAFGQRTALRTHMNVHSKRKPHKCGIDHCTAAFGDPSSCSRHRREKHSSLIGFECPICLTSIKRPSSYVTHLKGKHNIDASTINIEDYKRFASSKSGSSQRADGPVRERKTLQIKRETPVYTSSEDEGNNVPSPDSSGSSRMSSASSYDSYGGSSQASSMSTSTRYTGSSSGSFYTGSGNGSNGYSYDLSGFPSKVASLGQHDGSSVSPSGFMAAGVQDMLSPYPSLQPVVYGTNYGTSGVTKEEMSPEHLGGLDEFNWGLDPIASHEFTEFTIGTTLSPDDVPIQNYVWSSEPPVPFVNNLMVAPASPAGSSPRSFISRSSAASPNPPPGMLQAAHSFHSVLPRSQGAPSTQYVLGAHQSRGTPLGGHDYGSFLQVA